MLKFSVQNSQNNAYSQQPPPHPHSVSVHSQPQIETLFSSCGWLNPWIWNPGMQKTDCMFVEKNPRVSGPIQLNPMLFKGRMYVRLNAAQEADTTLSWTSSKPGTSYPLSNRSFVTKWRTLPLASVRFHRTGVSRLPLTSVLQEPILSPSSLESSENLVSMASEAHRQSSHSGTNSVGTGVLNSCDLPGLCYQLTQLIHLFTQSRSTCRGPALHVHQPLKDKEDEIGAFIAFPQQYHPDYYIYVILLVHL